jgi:hypothetical protein
MREDRAKRRLPQEDDSGGAGLRDSDRPHRLHLPRTGAAVPFHTSTPVTTSNARTTTGVGA